LSQFADWGVDFVKVDDLSRPYHKSEIEAIRKAMDKSGRSMIFSTSPGATTLDEADHIAAHANMWRISDDFWDKWDLLKEQFQRCADWAPHCGSGHFPDADMLPLGAITVTRHSEPGPHTRFTKDEQITMMTLWSICRSPLIYGGDLEKMDPFTLSLITNDEVIAVNQKSSGGRQLFRKDDLIAWTADIPGSNDKYLAVFNATDEGPTGIIVLLKDLGFTGPCKVRDLWKHQEMGTASGAIGRMVLPHGAEIYRLSPVEK
jgi:hypothetical protein